MSSLSLLLCTILLGQQQAAPPAANSPPPAPAAATQASSIRSKLLDLYLQEARDFDILRRGDPREKLVLREEPVYVWTNPLVANGQFGAVYVWTWRGRPEAVGSIFVYNFSGEGPRLGLMHEFHSVSVEKLSTQRHSGATAVWQPKAGITLTALDNAPPPAAKPAARLSQMRALAREFSAHSVSPKEQRWELRLLPQPLYRYDLGGTPVVDGALFAFVTSAGTDPELMLAIEARGTAAGAAWHYAPLRFTGFDLTIERHGKQVWKSLHADLKGEGHNLDYTYHVYRDRFLQRATFAAASPDEQLR